MRVAMQKVDGVQTGSRQPERRTDRNRFEARQPVTLAKLREVIKNNGFVSRDAIILASGAEVPSAKPPTFEVAGTGERLQLAGPVTKDQQGSWRFTSPAK